MTAVNLVFILGTGRSGSTLLHEVLARHQQVGFVSNLEDRLPVPPSCGRFNSAIYRRLPAQFTRKGRVRFAPSEGYRIMDRAVSPLLSEPFRDLIAEDLTPWLACRLRTFFEVRAQAQQKDMFLHKFTGWPRAAFLDAALPGCQFVHVIRDGRAVANSWLQVPWWRGHLGPSQWHFGPLSSEEEETWKRYGTSFVVLAGLAWLKLVERYDQLAAEIGPPRWLDVRYEDLVCDPGRELRSILDHLGLPWTTAFDRALVRQPFATSRREAFRTDLAPGQLESLNAVLGSSLIQHGYHV